MTDAINVKNNAGSGRNYLMDFMKGISAVGVVLVHFKFPGAFGNAMCSIGLAGVVFFYLISGYYAYSADGSSASKIAKRFKRNFRLTLVAIGIYAVYTIIENIIQGTFSQWSANFASPTLWLKILILGDFDLIHGDPLWFMVALLYAYGILYIIEKKSLHKIFYALLPLFLLLRICMETYTNSFNRFSWLDWHFSGNFLVGALPIMLLGNYIASHKDYFVKIQSKVVILGLIVSTILMFVFVNVRIGRLDISQLFKISTAFFAFICCIKYSKVHISSLIETLGEKYTLYLYLYHKIIGTFLCSMLLLLNAGEFVIGWILPVLVIIVSIAASIVIVTLKNRSKRVKA